MRQWNREEFARWLRIKRRVDHPISQDRLAELLGDTVTQSKVSRWEKGHPNTDAPTLDECLRLADIFEFDFIELARMCGRWSDELERRVLIALASSSSSDGEIVVFPEGDDDDDDIAVQKGAVGSAHNPRYVKLWSFRHLR